MLLTTHEAYDSSPVWSRDGRLIAFASDRSGNNDVYVMPSTGGQATRLTFHSAGDTPSDFTPNDSAVIFSSSRLDAASNQQFPSPGLSELYRVPLTGGKAQRILTTPAISFVADKKTSTTGWTMTKLSSTGGSFTTHTHLTDHEWNGIKVDLKWRS